VEVLQAENEGLQIMHQAARDEGEAAKADAETATQQAQEAKAAYTAEAQRHVAASHRVSELEAQHQQAQATVASLSSEVCTDMDHIAGVPFRIVLCRACGWVNVHVVHPVPMHSSQLSCGVSRRVVA